MKKLLRICLIVNILFTQYCMLLIINSLDISAVWGWGITMAFFFIPITLISILIYAYYLITKEKRFPELKTDVIILSIVILQNLSLFLSIPSK